MPYPDLSTQLAPVSTAASPTSTLSPAGGLWAVFPVPPGTKRTYAGTHGVKDATTDPEQIAAWWARWPDASIGGSCAGKLVIDLDRYAHPAGVAAWWKANKHRLPLTQKHGRGPDSRHLVFLCSEAAGGTRWRRELAPGVEIKAGPGAMVLLPPSLHPSGARYEVLDGRPPVQAPAWLIEACRSPLAVIGTAAEAPAPEPIRALTSREARAIASPVTRTPSEHTAWVAIQALRSGRTPGQVVTVLECDPVTAERWDSRPGLRERELRRVIDWALAELLAE
jgi:Bifunctional DNA primase/polymerase, N-terminal